MDGQAILQRVRVWGRVRNAVRTGLAAAVVLLAASLFLRLGGQASPSFVWLAIPMAAAVGGAWPVGDGGFLLRAGRQLGVRERYAALEIVIRERAEAFLPFLIAEIAEARPRGWRLLSWREGALAVGCVVLGAALVVFPVRRSEEVGGERPIPSALVEVRPLAPMPERPGPTPGAERQVTDFPELPDLLPHSPYADLLASLLGIEPGAVSPEELAGKLAQEEGLLRSLAERLRQVASGRASAAERADLVALARELSRADLRERVGRLVERGGEEGAREAAEAVEAALRTVEELSQRVGEAGEAGPGSASGPRTPLGELPDLPDGALPEGVAWDEGAEDPRTGAERDQPGVEPGEPLAPGLGGGWPTLPAPDEPVPVVRGEGPVRAHLVPVIPGEPRSPGAEAQTPLTPQEVEVVLQSRGVPPELREVVRRYFELVGGNP